MKAAKERLNYVLAEKGLTATKLSEISGVQYHRLRDIRSGKTKTISLEVDTKICNAIGINVDWLQFGAGDIMSAGGSEIAGRAIAHQAASESRGVPFVGDMERVMAGPMAGVGAGISEKDVTDRIFLPSLNCKEGDFAIKVYGRSMVDKNHPEQSINDGSILCLHKWEESYIRWGEIYCIATRDGISVKRLMPCEDKSMVKCVSSNEAEGYPPYEVAKEDITSIAKVTAIINCQILQ